ncbi:hypothetical protein [Sphingomonas turrisvirgatae]|uniref:Terminase small subunit protein n=1 Tax=Sphingomonas turrisvirgatae TaxID=1888892 RepID=A0A1E3LZX6_9SPHN|nr:hypothetical protein [Sphingomonas turrisvirgatae]ODP39366.1 hypothetical protein BFL28_11195 [Sphingomonas turrisvirgatae]
MTDEQKAELFERIVAGQSLRTICVDEHMPGKSTVMDRLASDEGFRAEYEAARALQAETLAHEILEIADTPVTGVKVTTKADGTIEKVEGDMIEHRRLQVDARKWLAGKLAPKKYGDASLLKMADADGKPIREMSEEERYVRFASIFAAIQKRGIKGD